MPDPTQPVDRRHEFVLFFDVTDGNPNGDPDAGNAPRADPETGQGLVTDVCLKRKIRNFVQLTQADPADGQSPRSGYEIYVKERGILANQQRKAYKALGKDGEKYDMEPGTVKDARAWMCKTFFDVRAFGAVMTVGKAAGEDVGPRASGEDAGEGERPERKGAKAKAKGEKPKASGSQKLWNCGQVRGPVQLAFARSVEPVLALEHAITRVALTNAGDTKRGQENDPEGEEATSGQMGRKATIPYGLYRVHGFVSPFLARDTRFSAADLALLWQALAMMFEHDRSATRGVMASRALVVFEHKTALGDHPAHRLFERVTCRRSGEGAAARRPARSFSDYSVAVDPSPVAGVTIHNMI